MANPKHVVATGYDALADQYQAVYGQSAVRQCWFDVLVEGLGASAVVLDLGCGSGIPVARDLVRAGFDVIGVDGSAEQIKRARRNVPAATFHQADMSDLVLPAESLDAVGAFYSLTHVPAREQLELFGKIGRWLKPSGRFVASLGTGEGGDWRGEWLGADMFFSHNSDQVSLQAIAGAGMTIVRNEVQQQDNETASFLWVSAKKL